MGDKPTDRRWLRKLCVVFVLGSVSLGLCWIWPGCPLRSASLARLHEALEKELSAQFQTPVSIEQLSLDGMSIELKGISATLGSASTMLLALRLGRARLYPSWTSLLWSGRLRVPRAEVEGATLDLQLGRENAQQMRPAPTWNLLEPLRMALEGSLQELVVERSTVTIRNGTGAELVGLAGTRLELRHDGIQLFAELQAEQLRALERNWRNLEATAVGSPSGLRVERAVLGGAESTVRVAGRVLWAETPPSLEGHGELRLAALDLSPWLEALTEKLSVGSLVAARTATGSFRLNGPLFDPRLWKVEARMALSNVAARAPDARTRVELSRLSFDAQHDASGLRLSDMRIQGEGMTARAELELLRDAPHRMRASVDVASLATLRRLAPTVPLLAQMSDEGSDRTTRVHAELSMVGNMDELRVQGRLTAGACRLQLAQKRFALPLASAQTRFDYRLGHTTSLRLSSLQLRTAGGLVQGWAKVTEDGHHIELSTRGLDLQKVVAVTWPRRIEGGKASGQVVIEGDARQPFASVQATLELRGWVQLPGHEGHGPERQEIALRGSGQFDGRRHHLRLESSGLGTQLLADVLPGISVHGTLAGSLDVTGTEQQPAQRVQAQLRLAGVTWTQPNPTQPPTTLHVKTASAHVTREGHVWQASNVDLVGSLHQARPIGSLSVEGRVQGSVRIDSDEHHFDVQMPEGRLLLPSGLGVEAPLVLTHAAATLATHGDEWALSSFRIDTKAGTLRGKAWGKAEQYAASTTLDLALPGPLSSTLPGLRSGQLVVQADVGGSTRKPVEWSRGSVRLSRARWLPSKDRQLCPVPLLIRRGSASYDYGPRGLQVDGIRMNADLLQARGSARLESGETHLLGELRSQHVGELLSLFPSLAGLARGGRGSAQVGLTLSSGGVSGRVEARIADSTLVLSRGLRHEPTRHPVQQARLVYQFSPLASSVQGLEIRGPEVNLNLNATWSKAGPVSGAGRLWLTSSYTDEITGGGRWALQLLGYPRIDTEFRLKGTAQDIRLDAAIAHDLRWQLLRIAVPDRIARLARGQLPLVPSEETTASPCAGVSNRWTNRNAPGQSSYEDRSGSRPSPPP